MKILPSINYNPAVISRVLEHLEGKTDYKPQQKNYLNLNDKCGCARGAIHYDMVQSGALAVEKRSCGYDIVKDEQITTLVVVYSDPRKKYIETAITCGGMDLLYAEAESEYSGLPVPIIERMEQLFEGFSLEDRPRGLRYVDEFHGWVTRSGWDALRIARWLQRVLKIEAPVQATPKKQEILA